MRNSGIASAHILSEIFLLLTSYQAEFKKQLEEFKKISTYVAGAYDEDSAFQGLEKHLKEIEGSYEGDEKNRVFYVSDFLCLLEKMCNI